MFTEILGFRTLSIVRNFPKVRKPNISVSYTPSSEPYSTKDMFIQHRKHVYKYTKERNYKYN
jgi:hypothetical protein